MMNRIVPINLNQHNLPFELVISEQSQVNLRKCVDLSNTVQVFKKKSVHVIESSHETL